MENKQDVQHILEAYLNQFPNEDHQQLHNFLKDNEQLFNRRNFNGHITASAFIADAAAKKVLLLKHKLYDRYLQPGGHVEKEDISILHAALREANEETGIFAKELIYIPLNAALNIPLDIDSHFIPANNNKNEPEHVHHDFRYLFVYKGNKDIIIPQSEAKDAKWVSFSALARIKIFSVTAEKISTLLP